MKKTFMLVSALAMVAMSIAVTSCKKDKDEPSSCTCTNKSGNKYVYAGSLLEEEFDYYEVNSCSGLGRGLSKDYRDDISCR